MKQYIDKDILMGQLNIDISNLQSAKSKGWLNEHGKGKLEGLEGIADFILHFCGKEVDLEKEMDKYFDDNFYITETWGIFSEKTENEINRSDLEDIAKHFFELGLKSKGGKYE